MTVPEPTHEVYCNDCRRFLGEGEFVKMRFPCRCGADVYAWLTPDGAILSKAEPRRKR